MSDKESTRSSSGLLIINPRREFLRKGALIGTLAGMAGVSLITSCKEENEEGEVSPAEDLMREHGRIEPHYDDL